MSVDSTLELYTTLYGWLFYNAIWDVLSATGIVFLPFIGILINTIIKSYQSEYAENASETTLRVLEMEFFFAFFVASLTAVPVVPLAATDLSFTPRALIGHPAQPVATPDNSQSTYGGSISFVDHPENVSVPLFWYLVTSFSSGFNRAVMEDIPPQLDYRAYANELREVEIDDPAIQAELNDFFRDCFVEARSKFLRERPQSLQITELIERYGRTDTQWLGSHVFLEVPGYYDTLRSDSIREGFVWSQLRDVEWDVDDHPTYGKPFCREWWTNSTMGLARKILDETDGLDLIAAAAEPDWDATQRRDAVIQAVMLNSPPEWSTRGYDFAYGNFVKFHVGDDPGIMASVQTRGKQLLAGYGLARESSSLATFLQIFLEAAPMIQALILMGLYTLMPLFVLMSRYAFSVFILGALILFSVKFWTVLWFFAWWVDQNLILALYPDPGNVTTLFSMDLTLKRVILNVLTGMMYIIFPILFTTYMSFSGLHAARELTFASGQMSNVFGRASNVRPSPRKAVAAVAKKVK